MLLLDSFSPMQLAIIAAAYFIAAVVKGVTGIGYSTTCLPILTLAIGLKEALPLVIIPSVTSNLAVMVGVGSFKATAVRFWPLLISAVTAVFFGIWTLNLINGANAAAVLGVVLIVYVVFALTNSNFRLREAKSRRFEPVVGAMTGFINGLTGSQVMPLVPYLLSLNLERSRFLQASNQSFTMSSVAMLVGLGTVGLLSLHAAVISLVGLVLVALGVPLGQRVSSRLSPDMFRKAVLIVLAALGFTLIVRAV